MLSMYLFFYTMYGFYCQVCFTVFFIKFHGCLVFSSIVTVQFT